MSFPKDFVWGAAAASYQIEGAMADDGKGASVWDMFCRKPGAIWLGQTGDVACDHYYRFREDVALMKSLGLRAYRLSISWPRVVPKGVGSLNAQGLAFYDAVIDELLAAGITPYVTLFHWDYPYELYCRGGWLNPDSPMWFSEYTDLVVRRLSDRVRHWMTINEPQVFVGHGHLEGNHAPGDKLGLAQVLRVAHNVLLAHGRAVMAIRAGAKLPSLVGFAPCGAVKIPACERPADIKAARRAMFAISGPDMWNFSWFSDPVFLKRYPADVTALYGAAMPAFTPDDMDLIGQPLDFLGANIYTGAYTRASTEGEPEDVPLRRARQPRPISGQLRRRRCIGGPVSCGNAMGNPSSLPKTALRTWTGWRGTARCMTHSELTSRRVIC